MRNTVGHETRTSALRQKMVVVVVIQMYSRRRTLTSLPLRLQANRKEMDDILSPAKAASCAFTHVRPALEELGPAHARARLMVIGLLDLDFSPLVELWAAMGRIWEHASEADSMPFDLGLTFTNRD